MIIILQFGTILAYRPFNEAGNILSHSTGLLVSKCLQRHQLSNDSADLRGSFYFRATCSECRDLPFWCRGPEPSWLTSETGFLNKACLAARLDLFFLQWDFYGSDVKFFINSLCKDDIAFMYLNLLSIYEV